MAHSKPHSGPAKLTRAADPPRAPRARAEEAHLGDAASLGLDPVIHERMRLGIISALAVRDALTFSELKKLLDATDGNLSVHARKLEEAEYVVCHKSFEGRVPRTEYRITVSGRRALERYLDNMEQIIRQTRGK